MPNDRVAVVTGASRGIGLEVARQLAEQSAAVVLTARTQEAVDLGLATLGTRAGRMEGYPLDVADPESIDAFFAWFWGAHLSLDILVNNAARVFGSWGQSAISDVDGDTILEALNNNTIGAYRMIKRALPGMSRAGYGRIVNVSSGMGGLTEMGGGSVAYRISKAALNAVTRFADAEAGPNVKVNSVCPGWVRTDMGGANATKDVSEGASGVVWAATLDDDGPSGGFFRDKRPIAW